MFKKFNAQEPKEILNIIRGIGSAEIYTDDDGDPVIGADVFGVKYRVLFYGYQSGKAQSLQFVGMWQGEDTKLSIREVNAWNQRFRFVKAVLDSDGDTALMMDAYLPDNGSREYLENIFNSWNFALMNIMKMFNGESIDR